jgi:hypothetical protein
MKAVALVAGILALTIGVQAKTKSHSKSIVIDSPADLPEFAQRSSEAMFLHSTHSGQFFLYLEQDQGKTLAILDVTSPASIRQVGRASLGARAPFDFLQALDDSSVLIHYRDLSGFAIVNFKKYKQPTLTAVDLPESASVRILGRDTLLLTSSGASNAPSEGRRCTVIDISNPQNPSSVVVIAGVKQELERSETGTMFLLNKDGLTVIRRPTVEEEFETESQANQAN